MIPFFRRFLVAFFTDPLAFRRWMRGLIAAAVPILLQVLVDKTWPTWTRHEWVIRLIPSVLAFAHGSMQSSAKKNKGAAPDEPPPHGYVALLFLAFLPVIATAVLLAAAIVGWHFMGRTAP